MTLAFSTSVFSQATGVMQPMLEEFTQASCPPCATQNPAFNALIGANQGQNGFTVNSLKYQTSWPGVDPMYNQNEAEVDARVSYYGTTGVPTAFMNGVKPTGGSYAGAPVNLNQTTLTNLVATAAPIEVDVVWNWANTSLTAINITVTVTNTNGGSNFSSADKLHVAIVEDEINFSSPPGSNGETDFFMVMRDMLPDNNGNTLDTVMTGSPLVFTFMNQAVPTNLYDLSNLGVVAFAQNNSSKQVFNSDYQTNLGFPPGVGSTPADMTISTVTTPLNSFCDANYIPSATVMNSNTFPIDSFIVSYVLDGSTPVTELVTVPLAAGASTTVTFPTILISNTSSFTYTYDLSTYNSTLVDVNTLNNAAIDNGPFPLLSTFSAVGTSLSTTFDGLAIGTATPANSIADNPNQVRAFSVNNTLSTAVTWNLGGFGNSNGCFRWDFFAISGGLSSRIVYEKIDLSAVPSNATMEIKWSHAYAQKLIFSNDALNVKVSIDCGATWTTVWSKVGTQLSTVTPVTSGRFYPAVTEWTADVADISAFIGQAEVLIAFEGLSNNGNCMYIDDVNTEVTLGVGTTTIKNPTTTFNVYPNPVRKNMTLEFSLEEATDMTISIVNALGQTVQNIANRNFTRENTLNINTSNLTSGVYFINAIGNDGIVTKRFVVEQ